MVGNIISGLVVISVLSVILGAGALVVSNAQTPQEPLNGVVMKGAYVSVKENNYDAPSPPPNYINDSFKKISEAGLDHVRFLFYWEAYEKNPEQFMKEIESVAKAADKYGIKVIYDNHQWHTSSWLERKVPDFLHCFLSTIQSIPKMVEVIPLIWQHNCSGLIGGLGQLKIAKEEMDGH